MYIHNRNHTLCENMNKIQLHIQSSGYAYIDKHNDWKGIVTNPAYSRLYYILNGEFYIIGKDGAELTLCAGNCYLLPAGYSFRYGCKNHLEHTYFHIKLCDFNEDDMLKNCPGPISCEFPKEHTESLRSQADSHSILGSLSTRQEVYADLYTLLKKHQINLEKKEHALSVRKAIEYIESHLSMQLNLNEIAANSFTAPSTLTRNFKRETGMTIRQYIDESIMFRASQMLHSDKTSILEISEHFGFCDQFYFARRFKEKYEMSPRDYRKALTTSNTEDL